MESVLSGMTKLEKEALDFHKQGRPGKIEVRSTKPTHTEKGLSLAYSPGVGAPCQVIAKNPQAVYDYTTKGNLVAVISNGTAVLGLGNIGPLAAKPVMEGKGILFKQFAGIDVFDIELNTQSVDDTVAAIAALEPTFGGINLEDIKAPECFEIEERLRARLKIPIFHDDQHGTAIVAGAALINACEVVGKKLEQIKVVVNGAGASAIACSRFFVSLGVKKENILMCDSTGVIYKGRSQGMNKYKEEFAQNTSLRTLDEALKGADVFVGLSVKGALKPEALKSMNDRPIIFALANPDPEITPDEAKKVRPDCVVATGRSDYPNQVNNVLGFPYIFRGALDVRATTITEEMKKAASLALARLAREDVPEKVSKLYGRQFRFGPDYLIPKPFDPRVLLRVAPAVAKAAMESGVAQKHIEDWSAYHDQLESLQGRSLSFLRANIHRVHANTQAMGGRLMRIVFPEGESDRILQSVNVLLQEKICTPILLGNPERIQAKLAEMGMDYKESVLLIDPDRDSRREHYVEELYRMRARKGVQKAEAQRLLRDPNYFAAMMVKLGDADGVVTGATQNYADAVRPILQVIGVARDYVAAGLNIALVDDRLILMADTTVHFDPDAETLAKMARQSCMVMEYFGQAPRVAMLSYSNFTAKAGTPAKMAEAARLFREMCPQWVVDGDIQSDAALNHELLQRLFPFSDLKEPANVLIFPNLESSNIGYKMLSQLGRGEMLGPFLLGVLRAANVLQRTTTVENIVSSVILTTLTAQVLELGDNKPRV